MKKAIAPLVSSILLIIFAVVLGIMVMSWGKSTYAIESASCDDTSLNIIYVDDKGACYTNTKVYTTIENNGEEKIDGVLVSVIGDKAVEQINVNIAMQKAEIKKVEVNYNQDIGKLKKIKIIPAIKSEPCPNHGFETDAVGVC